MCLRDGMHPKQHQITAIKWSILPAHSTKPAFHSLKSPTGRPRWRLGELWVPAASDETYLRAVVERVSQAGILPHCYRASVLSIISAWPPTVASPRFA